MLLPEEDFVRLHHMMDAARSVQRFVRGRERRDLDADEMLAFAVVHALQIIGEAASQVSDRTREAVRGIPWRPITGMRHRLVHGYSDVSLDRVWDTVVHHIPELLRELQALLPETPPSGEGQTDSVPPPRG
jgi:uncharacterized protein with HEPN domain